MKKIYLILICILVIISSLVLAQVYVTFEIPIKVTTPTPSEFRNGTSICYIGGSQGILNCTGNVTGNYIFGNLAYATGINQSNSTVWWAGISGWISGWFLKTGNNLDFNETKLNDTIVSTGLLAGFNSTANLTYQNYITANMSNSTTWWADLRGWVNNWLYNNGTGYLSFNETKLQAFNETAKINSVNTTQNIMNLGFTNNTELAKTFLNKSGDTMTGNLNMTANITLGTNIYICWDGPACNVYDVYNGSSHISKVN